MKHKKMRLSLGRERCSIGVDGQGMIKYFSSWISFFASVSPLRPKNYSKQRLQFDIQLEMDGKKIDFNRKSAC